MDLTQSVIWFIGTAFAVTALLLIGMYEGTHSYDVKPHHERRRLLHRH